MAKLDMIALFAVIITTAGYYLYFFLPASGAFRRLFQREEGLVSPTLSFVFATKATGFFTMGLLPAILYVFIFHEKLSVVGLTIADSFRYWYLLAGLPLAAIAITFLTSRNQDTYARYPEVRSSEWTITGVIAYLLGWILYLFSYEFLFRGLLLFSLCYAYGPVISVVINVALYSAFHLHKGAGETLGAIPLGLILCCCALLTSSFLLPFLIHASLAVTAQLVALTHNPDMKIITEKKRILP